MKKKKKQLILLWKVFQNKINLVNITSYEKLERVSVVQDLYAYQQLRVKDCLWTMKPKSTYEHNLFLKEPKL